ncbi:MAG: ABC transporter permease [Bacteroidota bacterium]
MGFFDVLEVALISLSRNKMRSFLTMLGIIIGVGAVIAMMAVGNGAQQSIRDQIASLGTNVILIFPGSTNQAGVRTGMGTATSLTEEDIEAIKDHCPSVALITPSLRTGSQVIYQELNWRTAIMGVNPEYFEIRSWPVESGHFFTEADVRNATKVCVVGQTIVENLFKGADPIGQIIRIRRLPFKIVGVLATKGQSAQGTDQDDVIFAPSSTVQRKMMGQFFFGSIMASAISENHMEDAIRQITEVLRVQHKLQSWDENDFTVRSQTEIANAAQSTSQVLTILLASIASISLIVGGIGIMNIMLVSVTERTKEIGLRMSVGATGKNILSQFLIEAIVLSLLGGLIGVLLGSVTSDLISRFAGWTTLVSLESIFLAFVFSAAVGIFFGFYPARKAAQLNPIEALRYE